MNQYISILKPAKPGQHNNLTPEQEELIIEHCTYLKEKFENKEVLQAGTSFEAGSEDGFGLVIFNAEDKEKAVQFMNEDPAVKQGVILSEVTEYNVFLDRGL